MVYTMFITLFLYYLWFFVNISFEKAKIAKNFDVMFILQAKKITF